MYDCAVCGVAIREPKAMSAAVLAVFSATASTVGAVVSVGISTGDPVAWSSLTPSSIATTRGRSRGMISSSKTWVGTRKPPAVSGVVPMSRISSDMAHSIGASRS